MYVEAASAVWFPRRDVFDLFRECEWSLLLEDFAVLSVSETEGARVDAVGEEDLCTMPGIGVVGVEGIAMDCLGKAVKVLWRGAGLDLRGEGFFAAGGASGI